MLKKPWSQKLFAWLTVLAFVVAPIGFTPKPALATNPDIQYTAALELSHRVESSQEKDYGKIKVNVTTIDIPMISETWKVEIIAYSGTTPKTLDEFTVGTGVTNQDYTSDLEWFGNSTTPHDASDYDITAKLYYVIGGTPNLSDTAFGMVDHDDMFGGYGVTLVPYVPAYSYGIVEGSHTIAGALGQVDKGKVKVKVTTPTHASDPQVDLYVETEEDTWVFIGTVGAEPAWTDHEIESDLLEFGIEVSQVKPHNASSYNIKAVLTDFEATQDEDEEDYSHVIHFPNPYNVTVASDLVSPIHKASSIDPNDDADHAKIKFTVDTPATADDAVAKVYLRVPGTSWDTWVFLETVDVGEGVTDEEYTTDDIHLFGLEGDDDLPHRFVFDDFYYIKVELEDLGEVQRTDEEAYSHSDFTVGYEVTAHDEIIDGTHFGSTPPEDHGKVRFTVDTPATADDPKVEVYARPEFVDEYGIYVYSFGEPLAVIDVGVGDDDEVYTTDLLEISRQAHWSSGEYQVRLELVDHGADFRQAVDDEWFDHDEFE